MIPFSLDTAETTAASAFAVSVIGIGGSGTNVIDKMALDGIAGADLISMNCDARALHTSMAGTKLQLGKFLTQGLGCGGDPELGAEAALAAQEEIRQLLAGRSMIFLCVGLGGGTGSGAAPVVARMAREAGAFVVVFATLPFAFEGRRRSNQAGLALQDLRKYANALVTFENDRMGELVVPKKGVQEAFELADRIIGQSVRAVSNLVTQPGLIHIGMDDLVTALRNTDSRCLFGYGQARGESRAVEALALALKSPLIDRGQMLSGARNVLVHICGGTTLTLFEIETLMRELGKHVHEDAQILFGAATDAKLQDNLSVTILTSLNKPVPVAEVITTPVKAVEEVPPAIPAQPAEVEAAVPETLEPLSIPAPAPSAVAPAEVLVQPAVVVMEAAQAPPAAVVQVHPVTGPAPVETVTATAAPIVPKTPAPAMIVEDELFPESVPVPLPGMVMEPVMIEVPALVVPAAPVPQMATVPDPVPVADGEVYYETIRKEAILITESVPSTAAPVPMTAIRGPETPGEGLEDDIPAASAAPAPTPEHVIRIERKPAPAGHHETARAGRRFALSDIIKRETAPVLAPEPVMEYEAAEEEEADPAPLPAPVRPAPAPAPAPVSRRPPDFDRVSPIRPIPAGRNTAPAASPFTTTTKPAGIPAPLRPVPTQQQTFDERLQPATSGGRFDRVKPTVEEGEDLDVPTFLRRKR